ncbi:MAG: hypothetical protein ACR2JP_06880 [Acidimicrobiia bacterium]
MEIFAFVLIGGIWAAFLLPSLVDGRRSAPSSSTRSFHRSQNLLASVAIGDARELMARKRIAARRQRILLGLVGAAGLSLVLAITRGSGLWLAVTIAADLAIGGYIAVLLQTRQTACPTATVVPLHLVSEGDPHNASVRVVAG